MSERLELEDIDDIEVIELSGKLWSSLRPQHMNVELSMESNIDEDAADPSLAFITLNTTVRDAIADTDSEDQSPIYESTTTVLVGINKATISQSNDAWPARLAQIAWPYLRSATVEHAHRLNAPELEIPFVLPEAQASVTEQESSTE